MTRDYRDRERRSQESTARRAVQREIKRQHADKVRAALAAWANNDPKGRN